MNKPKTIDEYISMQSEDVQPKLTKIRQLIEKAVPESEELISYGMPAFKYYGIIAWFAAFKNHYSVFVRPKYLKAFKEELKQYELSKSAIRIPTGKPVPVQLLTKIIKHVAKYNLEKSK
jgi:uncharacterized protein YdhG (YjbR/CyaY superfamily)